MEVFGLTDVGLVRKNNEDNFYISLERGLLVVADGMGGHAAGEVASEITVKEIPRCIPERRSLWPFGRRNRQRVQLVDAILKANQKIYQEAGRDSSRQGMGTTVVALWRDGNVAHLTHVGDSRAYRFRNGLMEQLTQDHAWPDEDGPNRNALTRAVGVDAHVEVDYQLIKIRPGDIFLLCSDGLTRMVEDSEIAVTIASTPRGEATMARLVELAKNGGAPDNVTVVLGYC